MVYENELIEILKEAYGNDWQNKNIDKKSIKHLSEILELKLNLLVNNIDANDYFEQETKLSVDFKN